MQQARGGGGNGNREQPDLSTLFDQELRKKQETNYEQQSTTQDTAQQNQNEQDPLAAIRELARRQEGLSKQQRDLAKNKEQMSAGRSEAAARAPDARSGGAAPAGRGAGEEDAAAMQASRSGATGCNRVHRVRRVRQGAQSQKLREISEEMRNAAGDLRREDPQQASARGAKAGEQLRGLEQAMQGARPEERKRAMGDLQLEARQLADAERRLGNEASRTAPGSGR